MGFKRKIGVAAVLATVVAGGGLAFIQDQEAAADMAAPAAMSGSGPNYTTEAGVQPIAFPHNVHAQTYKIDCAYCHYSAERSTSAGIPPVSTCMGCHTNIAGQNADGSSPNEQIALVRQYWEDGETIPWVRIHKVADHVKFPHMRHINAGLDCTQCHGPVEEYGVFQYPDEAWGQGKMGWCISCHVENDVSRDCTVCHY